MSQEPFPRRFGRYTLIDHLAQGGMGSLYRSQHENDGFQAIGGSRIPLIMFGGRVRQGIDTAFPAPHGPLGKLKDEKKGCLNPTLKELDRFRNGKSEALSL